MNPKYDRVTAILAPFSGIDKIDPLILQRAAQRGSIVHALCQGIIDGIDVEIPEHVKGYIDSFQQWAQGKEFLPNPKRMFNEEFKITGECDGLIKLNEEIILFDLKTSQQESCTWKYQGAAYSFLAGKYPEQHFIRLSKEGKAPKIHVYHYAENINTFIRCIDIYRTFFKNKAKVNEDYL